MLVLRWNRKGITVAGIVSNSGNGSNQLNTPVDVRLDYDNNIYIADRLYHRIQKYLSDSSVGRTTAGNGSLGSSSYQLYNPSRVIIDSNNNLYISDSYNDRIQFWRNGTAFGTTIADVASKENNTTYILC